MRALSIVILALTGIAASGCGEDCKNPGDPAITSFTVDPTTVTAGEATHAMVMTKNFVIGDDDEACHSGHSHVYLDSTSGDPLVSEEEPEFDIPIPVGTSAGTHTLIARLHGHDHKIIEPEVTASVTITVQ